MDKIGFDDNEKEYQKRLKELEEKIRAEILAEKKGQLGFKFSPHDRDWQLHKYPHPTHKDRLKAAQNNHDSKEANKKALEAEVARRMEEQRKTLEKLIFEQGRDQAKAGMEREEKIKAAKERFRKNEQKRAKRRKTLEGKNLPDAKKSKEVIKKQKQNLNADQNNAFPLNMKQNFQKQNDAEQQLQKVRQRAKNFKERQAARQELESRNNSQISSGYNDQSGATDEKEEARKRFKAELKKERQQKKERSQSDNSAQGY